MEWSCDDEVISRTRLRHFTSRADALSYLKCRGSISYALGSKYWGKGIVTKAVKMVVPIVFKEFPDVERVEGLVVVDNKASQRVLEKA
ncbi:hypothetical protein DITRI_Ditri15bG0081400 [Diplodiscus trichospermus]